MIVRALSLTLAAVFAGGVLADGAEADDRKGHRPSAERYAGPPEVFVGVPGLRLLFGDYALSREEYDALYGPDPQNFDESYYEPELIVPKPRKKPTAKAAKKTAPPDGKATASQPASPETTASLASQNGSATKSSAMSCDKASGVVSGFGFSGVKASSCSGKLYAFNATRDGKAFSIKLDPATGELTEVKKLP